ncbi:MAG TPA: S-layer homology domain-containing protein [Actinomycetota bacterium]
MSVLNRLRARFAKRRLAVIAAAAAVAIIVPAALTSASDSFSDVSSSHPFHDHINAIVNAGITAGCGSGKYCPSSSVTRGQMAVFLNKLGDLDGTSLPVVDAFMLNSTIYLDDAHTATLAGGAPTECETITFTDDLNIGFPIPFGAYIVQHQLFEAPVAETENINVQLRDSSDELDEDDDVYDVCFSTVDGSFLAAGDYKTYRQLAVFFVGNIFGSAGATSANAQTTGRRSPLRNLDR